MASLHAAMFGTPRQKTYFSAIPRRETTARRAKLTAYSRGRTNPPMYTILDTTRTRTEAPIEIGVVVAPDESYRDGVLSLLSHKRPRTRWQIECALREPLDELETRFYLGIVAGEAVAYVMTVEIEGDVCVAHEELEAGFLCGIVDRGGWEGVLC